MEVIIKLETISDFTDLIVAIELHQKMLETGMKEVNHKSTDEDIAKWVKYNRANANLETTKTQLKQALL